MTLRAAVGETVKLHFLALQADKETPYTGLTNSDFTKSLTKDNSLVTDVTITVQEVANGKYVVSFVPNAEGFWWAQVRVNATKDWYGESVRVRGYIGTPVDPEIPAGESVLYENNIIYLTLDSLIAATDGSTLGEDYTYYFTTTYNPMYSALRRIKLDLGPIISGIPDDTINLAIFEASLAADQNTFATTNENGAYLNFAKREYTTCLAELTLIRAIQGDLSIAGRMGKTLADLQVSRSGPNLESRADDLKECVARWQVPLQTGGAITPDASVKPGYSVKGSTAEDSTAVGREWEPTATTSSTGYKKPLANEYTQSTVRRWSRTFRRRS
jgi:hypothetical protein